MRARVGVSVDKFDIHVETHASTKPEAWHTAETCRPAYVKKQTPSYLPRLEDRQPNGDLHHRYWQRGGGYDKNTVEPKAAFNLIDDFHANPVRRGLCERPKDWIWSSAIEYETPRAGLLRVNRESLPTLYESR